VLVLHVMCGADQGLMVRFIIHKHMLILFPVSLIGLGSQHTSLTPAPTIAVMLWYMMSHLQAQKHQYKVLRRLIATITVSGLITLQLECMAGPIDQGKPRAEAVGLHQCAD
jgi:hypothetical protein